MKKVTLCLLIVTYCFKGFSQVDTIYTNSEKIPCSVKEVTPEAIKFAYIGEDIINSVYKTTVQKIVFKSGRIQTFAELTSYKTVKSADDFDNVTLTQVESEIRGLFKLGDVSSKAKGATVLSSMVKVKERATRKMKIEAAMMGANIVYLTQNLTSGNQVGTKYQAGNSTETNLSGVAYSNHLPDYGELVKLIGDRKQFSTLERYKLSGSYTDFEKDNFEKDMELVQLNNENGLIMINAKITGVDNTSFRIINFTKEQFIIMYKEGQKIYNYTIKL